MGEEYIIMFWGVLISSQTGNTDSYHHFEVPMTLYEKGVCESSPALSVCTGSGGR